MRLRVLTVTGYELLSLQTTKAIMHTYDVPDVIATKVDLGVALDVYEAELNKAVEPEFWERMSYMANLYHNARAGEIGQDEELDEWVLERIGIFCELFGFTCEVAGQIISPLALVWTDSNKRKAHQFGWDLFQQDNGSLSIDALDDPLNVCASEDSESKKVFEGDQRDYAATGYVYSQAAMGNTLCTKAIKILHESIAKQFDKEVADYEESLAHNITPIAK
jgi:hypothetical protein